MKVYIGPHVKWIGPYQIAEKILFWKGKYHPDPDTAEKHCGQIHAFGKWLEGADDKPSLLLRFCQWIHSKQKREVDIHIDGYDAWNADQTLAMIIHPVLVKLKENKHGGPHIDDSDVPKELRSTSAPALTEEQKNCAAPDDNWFKRWEYVLNEIIWTFEQHADSNWESQYYSGEIDFKSVKLEGTDLYTLEDGPNHTFKADRKAIDKHRARMKNGRRLFAKYYESLWD